MLAERVRELTGAQQVHLSPAFQTLWNGYGELRRATLLGPELDIEKVVLKCVAPPPMGKLSKQPSSLRAHERKLRSYAVESEFYKRFAGECSASCRVPQLIASSSRDGAWLFVLEDLDAAGFGARRQRVDISTAQACLAWLAAFHAVHFARAPTGLWKCGTYWHLKTRPDEWQALSDGPLKRAAAPIDARLNAARFKTVLHGDAKIDNFCFAKDGTSVAAVDFQYSGGGIGAKDVAYFLSSCFEGRELERHTAPLLSYYFEQLKRELLSRGLASDSVEEVLTEWARLYPFAVADFERFMRGWAPGSRTEPQHDQLTRGVLKELGF